MSLTTKKRLLWLLLLSTAVWSGLMSLELSGFHRQKSEVCKQLPIEHGSSSQSASPIAALELTRSAGEFRKLIQQCDDTQYGLWNIHVVKMNTCMDFLFIGLYGSVLLLFAGTLEFPTNSSDRERWLIRLLRIAVISTMALDVCENLCILISLHRLENHSLQLIPPGYVSQPKWEFLGISLLILAALFALAKKTKIQVNWREKFVVGSLAVGLAITTAGLFYHPALRYGLIVFGLAVLVGKMFYFPIQLMAGSLAIAGLLVLVGVYCVPLLTWGIGALGVALVVGLVLNFPIECPSLGRILLLIETLYLVRFQILGGLLLSVVLPLGYIVAPSMFLGLFDALAFRSLVCVVWAAIQLAWTVMITTETVFWYGRERYSALRLVGADRVRNDQNGLSWETACKFAALALPVLVMTICGTSDVTWCEKIIGVALGAILSVLTLYAIAAFHARLPDPHGTAKRLYPPFPGLTPNTNNPSSKFFGRMLGGTVTPRLARGILDSNGRVRSGHLQAAAALIVLGFIYTLLGIGFSPHWGRPLPAAMFFLLFLLNLLVWLFSGAAFLLDAVRLPVLTVILTLSLVIGAWNTDHSFQPAEGTAMPPNAADMVEKWKLGRGKEARAAVVVATAGGGIRASAWTAEVLTGIADHCGTNGGANAFSSSLLLVSSVSGGSEGSMWVVGAYEKGSMDLTKMAGVRKAASESGLSAVGWGLLYPDLLRTIPGLQWLTGLPGLRNVDRGWALEKTWDRDWKADLGTSAPNLSDWMIDSSNGDRPAVIFNSTTAETGERIMIGTTLPPPIPPLVEGELPPSEWSLRFSKSYKDVNLPLTTAARLSATFPWVTPMEETLGSYHFADGGYYDNSGVMSASEWLLSVQGELADKPVVMILIDTARDTGSDSASNEVQKERAWSWQRQILAPIETLKHVNTSSQQSRADLESTLLRGYLKYQKLKLSVYEFGYPPDPLAPLSWHLTQGQKRKLSEAWSNPTEKLRKSQRAVYSALGCSVEP